MPKHQINYTRKMPDHRMPFDYKFMKTVSNPLDYFKVQISLNASITSRDSTFL